MLYFFDKFLYITPSALSDATGVVPNNFSLGFNGQPKAMLLTGIYNVGNRFSIFSAVDI